jgi:hypothetical protein
MEEMAVQLKHPRGSIKSARVLYEFAEDLQETGENAFRAWIYMGKGKATYAEMQTGAKGSRDIKSFYEYGDNPDVGPRYQENGEITHREQIDDLVDWKLWLKEYVSGLDPLDHFRFYREVVGGF